MKKAWSIMLGAVVLAAVALCLGGTGFTQQSEKPLLTQETRGIVLETTNRELVVQCAERAGTELRTVRFAKTTRNGESMQVNEVVQVGDLVVMETELHSDNTETLLTVEVISAGNVTPQQAAEILAGTQQAPKAVEVDEAQQATAPVPADSSTPQSVPAQSHNEAS